jgi:predicted acyl esterase
MRRLTALVLVALLGATLLVTASPPSPAAAKPARIKCKALKVEGKPFRFCQSAFVPQIKSADGTARLDVDVTLPAKSKKPLGLIVMLHGLGGSKKSFEMRNDAGKVVGPIEGTGGNYHLNHLWFASKGYAVLTYTARGFHESKCLDDSIESTDGDLELYGPSPACRAQLDSIDHEIKDTQYLIGRLVDGTLLSDDSVKINPSRVGVVGVSYGGGHTWLLSRRNSFKSPKGTRIKIGAAVPIIGWTDLVEALTPNGKARDDFIPTPEAELRAAETPGVLKDSYVGVLYFSMIQTTGALLPGYLTAWKDNFDAGPPYDNDVSLDAINKLLTKRSAYYIDKKGSFDTPLLVLQGFTDTLFPANEGLRMVNSLTGEDPDYPVKTYIGDIGHPIAQNKAAEVAYHNDLILKWFNFYLRDKGTEPSHNVEARFQDCYSEDLGPMYRGATWAELVDMPETPVATAAAGVLDTAVTDPHAGQINPVPDAVTCPTTDLAVAEGNVAVDSDPLEADLDMLGLPEATFEAVPTEGNLYVALRLWDVDPVAETQTLVTRGVYQLAATPLSPQDVSVKLFGNGWTFPAGHVIRLELTANDAPTMLAPGTGTIALSGIKLNVPQAVGEPVPTQAVPARILRKIGRVTYGF